MSDMREENRSAHVIVVGNEKGGSGKSTLSMHLIVWLLNAGQSVAAIDLDARQGTLSRYIQNRKRWEWKHRAGLRLPVSYAIQNSDGTFVPENEASEFARFSEAISASEHSVDFIVIDTPATDSYLMRLSHSMADTLVSPMNDSFIDFDVLGRLDEETGEVTARSHYADIVREARRQRHMVDGGRLDWMVVRNRMATLASRNMHSVGAGLEKLALTLGFRVADGIAERVIFRSLFPKGLTALDPLDEEVLGQKPSMSHLSARREIRALIERLNLPIDEHGVRRAEARSIWQAAATTPLDIDDVLAAE